MTRRASFPKAKAEELIRQNTEISGSLRWEPLYGDGSQRAFFRVSGDKGNVVVVWSPPVDQTFPNESDSYVYVGKHLHKKGVPVPLILGHSRSEGLTLVEDLGSVHLQDLVKSADQLLVPLYHQALGLLLKMQIEGARDLDTSLCFDTPVYDSQFIFERELEYFRWSFLEAALGLEINSGYLTDDFLLLASKAETRSGEQFFIHRDFQSRNLMVKGEVLYIIDFQGARLGPPQYDLASLLLDPYVQLPESQQDALLKTYSRKFGELTGISVDEFLGRYFHVALCRNLQILAAFSFLTRVKGRSHFARYIPPAWMGLRRLLKRGSGREYRLLANLVQQQSDELVAGAAARLEREARAKANSQQPAAGSQRTEGG